MRSLLPLALLLAAMSSVFAFGHGDRGAFYLITAHQGGTSSAYMARASNLSPKHNFLIHTDRRLGEDGAVEYTAYNRFPIVGYALMKLAALPFADNLSAQIYAAKTLMLTLFVGTAALAYLAVSRLSGNRWVALSATLLAFSSGYSLYYNDLLASEVGMDLFGVMLAFHGMVVFAQEGRFRLLLVKACVAVCLGWHAYALLLPFIAIGLAGELVGALRASSSLPALARAGRVSGALVRSRHIALGAAALALGLALLAFNFGNEYLTLGGETPFSELPSVASALERAGIARNDAGGLDYWGRLLGIQFVRIGAMLTPFALDWDFGFLFSERDSLSKSYLLLGLAGTAACAAGLFYTRHKALWATLALAGFCWALPMRLSTEAHRFEAAHYLGIPLFAFTLILIWVAGRRGERAVRGLSAAAMAVFVVSAFMMTQLIPASRLVTEDEFRAARTSDFEAIRKIAKGAKIFVAPEVYRGSAAYATHFYLHGSVIIWKYNRGKADFIVSRVREDAAELLTPDNQMAFLYDNRGAGVWTGLVDSLVDGAEPIYRAEHADVYEYGGRMHYIGAPGTFEAASLSDEFTGDGWGIAAKLNIGRRTGDWRWERGKGDGNWSAVPRQAQPGSNRLYIPAADDVGYRLRARAKYIDNSGVQSEAISWPTKPVRELAAGNPRLAAREPTPKFFLHVIPVDQNDLPDVAKSAGAGFENFDFHFGDRLFDPGRDSRQTVMVELPSYPIAAIKTGQFTGDGKLWEVKARLDGDDWIVESRSDDGG